MQPIFRHSLWYVLVCSGLCSLAMTGPVLAADPQPQAPSAGPNRRARQTRRPVKDSSSAANLTKNHTQEPLPAVNLLEAYRTGQVGIEAEGTGDGRMTLSITNRTRRQLRVILPPGLIASGATGQFGGMGGMMGGMGGMGGMGMMGGMGGMMGGMGGGMMGGMGGGMMGGMGMMGGGMGMMGGGMMGRGMMGGGMLTLPPMFGLMMLARLIMVLVGDRDSWDVTSLRMGMMGGGMGMMGGGMGMMGGMGGMGMGMRSVPPTGLPHATLNPGQTRHLPTRLVSLSRPGNNGQVALPQKGEPLQIGEISQLSDNGRVQEALKRLAAAKAPLPVAQLVMWHVAGGVDWATLASLSRGWANSRELALARQFVEALDGARTYRFRSEEDVPSESARFYFEVSARDAGPAALAQALQKFWTDRPILGLPARLGVPERPEGPGLACRVRLGGTAQKPEAAITVSGPDPSGEGWRALGDFKLDLTTGKDGALQTEAVADAVVEGVLAKLVRAKLQPGPKVRDQHKKVHSIFYVLIENQSPLVLNGLALAGKDLKGDEKPGILNGIAISPGKVDKFPATEEVVNRLGLKQGVRIIAADLSGL
jgi:hypothetical protein